MTARFAFMLCTLAALAIGATAGAEPKVSSASAACTAASDASCPPAARLADVTCFLPLASVPSATGPRLCVRPGPARLGSRWGAGLELRF